MKQKLIIITLLIITITLAKMNLDLAAKVNRYENSFEGEVNLNDYSGDIDCSELKECDF